MADTLRKFKQTIAANLLKGEKHPVKDIQDIANMQRKRFEHWCKRDMCWHDLSRFKTTGDYQDNHISDCWDAWQAALRSDGE